ncbi:hypothetical protein GJ496_006028 [Pomphorhynchus laevis]|nr:hypothetical protein GJ496_006028 [Pomphorhynchus laevis]
MSSSERNVKEPQQVQERRSSFSTEIVRSWKRRRSMNFEEKNLQSTSKMIDELSQTYATGLDIIDCLNQQEAQIVTIKDGMNQIEYYTRSLKEDLNKLNNGLLSSLKCKKSKRSARVDADKEKMNKIVRKHKENLMIEKSRSNLSLSMMGSEGSAISLVSKQKLLSKNKRDVSVRFGTAQSIVKAFKPLTIKGISN